MRKSLKQYKELVEIKNVDGRTIPIWTAAFQTALNENSYIYIPSGKFYIDNSVVIPSNRKIVASRRAEICLVKGTKVLMLRNQDVINGSMRHIREDEPKSENISIEGGLWSEENTQRGGYGKSGAFDESDSLHGVICLMLFSGVNHLRLRNMKFKHTAGFAIQIGRCNDFVVENIKFIDCFADGVHINGDTKNGRVRNIRGVVGDDLVALNAYDWDNSTINNGPIENLLVEKVCASDSSFINSVRLLSGIVQGEEEIDCFIKNVHLRDIRNVSTFKMYHQTPEYKDKPDGTKVGNMENILLEDITIKQDGPEDRHTNYLKGDPITGHFGVFELGCNIDGLHLKNIKVQMNDKDYSTAHMITVGPKSCRLEEYGWVELFDPYVECVVRNLTHENVTLNGKKVVDLKKEVKEVSFEQLYPSENGFGSGKVEWEEK